jgi:hypothetical protein
MNVNSTLRECIVTNPVISQSICLKVFSQVSTFFVTSKSIETYEAKLFFLT